MSPARALEPGADLRQRRAVVRELEGAFSELMEEYRRAYILAAESVSAGMLPGTFKVLSAIQRAGSITVSGLAERLTADKGYVSRAVSELGQLGLVERIADASDARLKRISLSAEGARRIDNARSPHEQRLSRVLEDWPLESITQLTGLLQALTRGERPEPDLTPSDATMRTAPSTR